MSQITTNVATPEGFAPDPKIAAQVAELRALEAQFPEPPLEDALREREWLYDLLPDATKDLDWPYWNQYIAVYKQQIVGSGSDYLQLQIDTARKFGIHPGRLFITHIGE
jgi:hypothetical protein